MSNWYHDCTTPRITIISKLLRRPYSGWRCPDCLSSWTFLPIITSWSEWRPYDWKRNSFRAAAQGGEQE